MKRIRKIILVVNEKINEAIDVNEIEVIDYIELIPTEEKNEIGEVIHEMEDHMLFEPLSELSENSTLVENSDIIETEVEVETEVETEVKEEIVSEISDFRRRNRSFKYFTRRFTKTKI